MEPKELIRKRASMWAKPKLLFWPFLLAVLGWVVHVLWDKFHVAIPLILTGLMVVFWFVAWVVKQTHTYVVFEDTVFAQHKFISRATSEARIAVIRSINVNQSLYQRLLRIGDVEFKSAGDIDDVIFEGISDPEGLKKVVQQQHSLIERRQGGATDGEDEEET